jgi:hypothetical protein
MTTSFKKTLRETFGFDNIKQTYSIFGVKTADEAYKLLNKEYQKLQKEESKQVSKQKANEWLKNIKEKVVKKQEQQKEKVIKKQEQELQKLFLKMRQQNRKEITIDLNKYKSIKQAIELIIKNFDRIFPDKKYNLIVNGKHYPMTNINKYNILELIKKSLIQIKEEEGSDADFVAQIFNVKEITIELFETTNKYKKANGAFFKYIHKTELDLSRLQIYNKLIINTDDMLYWKEINFGDTSTMYDNCLVYALTMGGLKDEKLQQIRLMCKSSNIPVCKFEELCKLLEIRINLKKMCQNQSRVEVYGKQFKEEYNIGLLDEHFFINEKTDITEYALINYFDLQEIKDFNYIYRKQGEYYKKDKTRCIYSFDLVKILIDNKDKFLTQLNKLDVTYTQNYSKMNDDIINLNYTPSLDLNYRPVESIEQRRKRKNKCEIKKIEYTNIFFDFETSINSDNIHFPYLCCFIDDNNNKGSFYGEDCGLQMLKYLSNNKYKNIRLIAHNSSYDIRFLYKYLIDIEEITKGTKVISCKCKFNNLNIEIKDSLLLIAMPLKKFPKTFKIDGLEKEVISYDMYNQTDCLKKRFITITEGIKWIKKEGKDVNQFISNIKKWSLQILDQYDCIEYSKKYCEIDCYILKQGYNTFKEWMQKLVNIDTDKILTIASLAHKYFIEQDCYKGVNEIGSIPQAFIQKCVVGGRVMSCENKKYRITNKKIMDFDAVSLYPSAMYRMDGFLKGLPKVITDFDFNNLKNKDGYFIEIKITSVGINRKFPLMSYINNNGIRTFTNDMIGKIIYIDKISLEDLINFQNIKFEIIRGYYFDEGLNSTINNVIKKIFNERVKLKRNKNPAEIVYKLIMNSGYGKSIMKEIESETKYFNNENDMKVFISRNYNWLIHYEKLADSNLHKVKLVKPLDDHFNIAQVGVSILSMSKRIMNEVMCLSEDNKLNIYYQDTDSMHIEEQDIELLSNKFNKKYGRELIGEDMGQFHSDFELEGCKNIYASKSIFLGKKCYIDELKGIDENGNEKIGFHIRMKGIPSSCIKYTSNKLGYKNAFELYEELYNGKQIEFDLTEEGNKANFKFETNGTVKTLEEFKRKIVF